MKTFWVDFLFYSSQIRIGDYNHSSTADDENALTLDIKEIFIHPKYVDGIAYFDVAILETEPLNLSASIQPICLPTYTFDNYDEQEVQLIGWGAMSQEGDISETLKRADVTIFSQR